MSKKQSIEQYLDRSSDKPVLESGEKPIADFRSDSTETEDSGIDQYLEGPVSPSSLNPASQDSAESTSISDYRENFFRKRNNLPPIEPEEKPLTKEGRQKRITVLNAQIKELEKRRKKEAMNPALAAELYLEARMPGKEDVGFIQANEKVDVLTGMINEKRRERQDHKWKVEPIPEDVKNEINSNINNPDSPLNYQEMVNQYGEETVKRVERENADSAYQDYNKEYVKKHQDYNLENHPSLAFNFENIMYGEMPEVDDKTYKDIEKFYNGIKGDKKFLESDYKGKADYIVKNLKEYLAGKVEDPEERKRLQKKYIPHLVKALAYDDTGNLSMPGLKMLSEMELETIRDRELMLEQKLIEINAAKKEWEYSRDPEKIEGYDPNTINKNYRYVAGELEKIQAMKSYIDKIITMPERKSLLSGFKPGLHSHSAKDLITVGFQDMANSVNVVKAINKAKRGEEVTFAEQKLIELAGAMEMANKHDTQGVAYTVGAGLSQMLPYVASFGATSGIYKGVKGGLKKAFKQSLGKSMAKSYSYKLSPRLAKTLGKKTVSLPELATTSAARLGGASMQTIAMPQMYVKNTAENLKPNMDLVFSEEMDDMVAKIDWNSQKKLPEAFKQGYWEAFAEVTTERMGSHIMRSLKMPGRYARAVKGKSMPRRLMLNKYLEMKNYKGKGENINRFINERLGWNGIFEEYSEEVVNGAMASWGTDNKWDPTTVDFWEDQLSTFLTVAAFGGMMNSVKTAYVGEFGDNVKYRTRNVDSGKKKSISIPTDIHDELLAVINDEGYIDGDKIDNILRKNSKRLDKDQAELILDLSAKAAKNKAAEQIVEKGQGKAADKKTEPDTETQRQQELEEALDDKGKERISILKQKGISGFRLYKETEKAARNTPEGGKLLNRYEAEEVASNSEASPFEKAVARYSISKGLDYWGQLEDANEHKDAIKGEWHAGLKGFIRDIKKLYEEELAKPKKKKGKEEGESEESKDYFKQQKTSTAEPEGDQERDMTLLTAEEQKEVDMHNARIEEKYPELVELDYILRDQNGRYVEPTVTDLADELDNILDEIKEKDIQYTQSGDLLTVNDESIDLERRKEVLRKSIAKIHGSKNMPWDSLISEEKFERLIDELESGKELTGEASKFGNHGIYVKLDDGRRIKGYEPFNHPTNAHAQAAVKAMTDPKAKVSLQITPKEEWNPDDKFGRKINNIFVPYGDKIDIVYNGKVIGSVEETSFGKNEQLRRKAAQMRIRTRNEFGDLAESVADAFRVRNKVVEDQPISNSQAKEIKKNLFNTAKAIGQMVEVNLEQAIQYLKDAINNTSSINDLGKRYLMSTIDANIDDINKIILEERLKTIGRAKKGTGVKASDLQLGDPTTVTLDNPDSPAMTGADKVDSHLKTFRPVWTSIAERNELTIDLVEKTFYQMMKLPGIRDVKDENTWYNFLERNRTLSHVSDKIVNYLLQYPYESTMSMINFYRNVKMTKQYAPHIKGKGVVSFKLLNPSQDLEDFISSFNEILATYTFDKYTGIEAVRARINQFMSWSYQIMDSEYPMAEPARKEELRRNIHNAELKLLSDITGIEPDIWSEYFNSKTRETVALSRKDPDSEKDFKSYENILSHERYRMGKNSKIYPWIRSNIIESMRSDLSKATTLEEYKDHLVRYFTEDSEDRNVFSNLYKLSTSIESTHNIGLHGNDVKSNRFSSFVQYSHVFHIADNIHKLDMSNKLVEYYKTRDKPADIIFINGINNLGYNQVKVGLSPGEMTTEDIMVTQMLMFFDGKESYLASMGKYGDKSKIQVMETPKYQPTTEEYKYFAEKNDWFNDAVKAMQVHIANNPMLFKTHERDYPVESGLSSKEKINARRNKMARHFVYNYAQNTKDINRVFHGRSESYTDAKNPYYDLVKRAGSYNSPGYRPINSIPGGMPQQYTHAVANDKILKDTPLEREAFDGYLFMSGSISDGMAKSMGTAYFKPDQYDVLTSAKFLHSNVDPETGLVGLTKINAVNIDVWATMFPESEYGMIKKFMNDNGIDMLSFDSGTKKHEKTTNKDEYLIQLLDDKGRFKLDATIPKKHGITIRNTNDLYVQQDLRHTTVPKPTKMPSQFHANMMSLSNSESLLEDFNRIRDIALTEIYEEFIDQETDVKKLSWIKENINSYSQPELARLLEAGITINEPSFQKMMQTLFSSMATKRALEIPINRVTSQEVPDAFGILENRRPTSDGKHILLSDIASNITGARAHDRQFLGNSEAAIEYVEKNKARYRDLYNSEDNLMEWEITERDGIIPGEPVISTRVPADDLHSHSVSRLAYNLEFGNFTMLASKDQIASGSDYDGDQRFDQVLFKNQNGNIRPVDGDMAESISNRAMMTVVEEYGKPENDKKIRRKINTEAYDHIIEEELGSFPFKSIDPRAFELANNDNAVGVEMKGILTDLSTVFSIVSNRGVKFKRRKHGYPMMPLGGGNAILSAFVRDDYGLIKHHLGNLLNLAFDNAKDPKIEKLGLNEVTVNMYFMALTSDRNLSSVNLTEQEQEKRIMQRIAELKEFFTSPLLTEFIRQMRKTDGALHPQNLNVIFESLEGRFKKNDVSVLRNLYYASMQVPKIRALYKLTQKAPNSINEYIAARDLLKSLYDNSFGVVDTRKFFVDNQLVPELRIIDQILNFSEVVTFSNSPELTPVGRQISGYVLYKHRQSNQKKTTLSEKEIQNMSYGIKHMLTQRAVSQGSVYTYDFLRGEAVDLVSEMKDKYPGNEFLKFIRVVKNERRGSRVQIAPSFQFAKISDDKKALIRDSFDKFSEYEKDILTRYVFQTYGVSSSTFNGSFYELFSDAQKIKISELVSDELDKWETNDISPLDKKNIAEWIFRASRNEEFRKLADVNNLPPGNYDIGNYSSIKADISPEAIEAATTLENKEAYLAWKDDYNVEADLKGYMEALGLPTNIKAFTEHMRDVRKSAQDMFPERDDFTDKDVKDMLAQDSASEALAADDPALNTFIYNHLSEQYPGVQIFTDRDAFYEFVRKNGGRGHNVNLSAVGHAFRNAVYIDPQRVVTSSLFHEFAHIYWDTLPADHSSKKQLRDLMKEQYGPTFTEDEIEEKAIIMIGKAGANIADVDLNGNLMDRFIRALQSFWRSVKKLLGVAGQQDLVNDLAIAVYNNRDNIRPETAHGEFAVRNMIIGNDQGSDVQFNEGSHTYYIGDAIYPSVTNVVSNYEIQKFDPAVTAKKAADKWRLDFERTEQVKISDEMVHEEFQALQAFWIDETKHGSTIHGVAEHVFKGKDIPEDVKSSFENPAAFNELRNSLQKLKTAIKSKYPEAEFSPEGSEMIVASPKYHIAGTIDLVFDIGNDEQVIIDFKTTREPFVMADGELNDKYTRTYGYMKAPFRNTPQSTQTKHRIQTMMYANMLEEQQNSNNPDKKNHVKEIWVVPLVRIQSDAGLIKYARIADQFDYEEDVDDMFKNFVEVKWRNEDGKHSKRNYGMINQAMSEHYAKRKGLDKTAREYRNSLIKQNVPFMLVDKMVEAFTFMQRNITSDLSQAGYRDVEELATNALTKTIGALPELGYNNDDVKGSDALPVEFIFYAVDKKISKTQLLNNLDEYVPEKEVDSIDEKIPNPANRDYRWFHISLDEQDYILQDVGHENLKKDDEVMRIVEPVGLSGKKYGRQYSFFTIISTKNGIVQAIDQETGDTIILRNIEKDTGALKLKDKLPSEKLIKKRDWYEPVALTKKTPITQRHWQYPSDSDIAKNQPDKRAAVEMFDKGRKIVEWFFRKHSTVDEVRVFLNDINAVSDLYERLRVYPASSVSILTELLKDTLFNHYTAEEIRTEVSHGTDKLMPAILNLYHMIQYYTDEGGISPKVSSDIASINHLVPQRMINGRHMQLHTILNAIDDSWTKVTVRQSKLRALTKDLVNEIDVRRITYKFGRHTYYNKPSDPGLTKKEREYLNILYDHKYQNNAYYYSALKQHLQKGGEKGVYPKSVKVSSVYATKAEMKEKVGRRWGKIVHDLMSPRRYDNVSIEVVRRGFAGVKVGTGQYTTLKEIKDDFIFENATPQEKKLMLGPRYLWRVKSPPWIKQSLTVGMLDYYTRQAKKKYKKQSDLNPTMEKRRQTIKSLGQSEVRYQTQHILEAEEMVMESEIFANHMKRLIGPLDYMLARLNQETSMHDYITKIRNYLMFRQKPGGVLEGEGLEQTIGFFRNLNSVNKIAYQLRVQGVNFAIGQGMNIMREPVAYTKGMDRMFKDPKSFVKAYNILKRYGIANMSDDAKFRNVMEKSNFRVTDSGKFKALGNIKYDKFVKGGYWLMERVEKANQLPIFLGLMTKSEWEDYGQDGYVKEGKLGLSNARRRLIHNRVKAIHGDYGIKNSAPFWYYNIVSAMLQFGRWIPAMYHNMFSPYMLNSDYEINGGLFSFVHLLARTGAYNLKSEEHRSKKYEELLLKYEDKEDLDNVFFKNAQEYLEHMIMLRNGGRVWYKGKGFGKSEIDNIIRLANTLGMAALLKVMAIGLGGDDDSERRFFKKPITRAFLAFILRFQGDLFYFADFDQMSYKVETPLPFIDIVLNSLLFFIQGYEYFEGGQAVAGKFLPGPDGMYKNSNYYPSGTPKFLVTGTYAMPAGSQIRWTFQTAYQAILKYSPKKYPVKDPNGDFKEFIVNLENPFPQTEAFLDLLSDEEREEAERLYDEGKIKTREDVIKKVFSKAEFQRAAQVGKVLTPLMEKYGTISSLEDRATSDAELEAAIMEYLTDVEKQKRLSEFESEANNAVTGFLILNLYETDPQFRHIIKKLTEKSDYLKDIMENVKIFSDKKLERINKEMKEKGEEIEKEKEEE